MTTELYIIHMS